MKTAKHIFREKDLIAIIKRIKHGWDAKLGFAVGPQVEVTSLAEYEKEFSDDYGIDRNDFELKKKKKYEKDLACACLTMHVAEDKRKEINDKMKTLDEDKENAYEFYSYVADVSIERHNALVLNQLLNVPMDYKTIKGAHVRQNVLANGAASKSHQVLLNAKQNDIKLFECKEQWFGRRKD